MKVKWRTILFVIGMMLIVVLLMDFSRRIEKMDRLAKELESVQVEATSVMETQVELITQIAYATSDEAVEKWAYEDGKWVKPGEQLVEIIPAGEAAQSTSTPSSAESGAMSKWRIWWELFFGDQP
jgi:uncharacterized protein (DUF2147 family)